MKNVYISPIQEKAAMGSNNIDTEDRSSGSILVEKRNHCVIFPSDVSLRAETVERKNKSWFARAKAVSDLVVQLGENTFHLHKLPMVSSSGFINRMVFRDSDHSNRRIQIDNLPGGAKIFELVVKFCYGLKVNLTASNVAPLYCAANYLEMSCDLKQGNLIAKTDSFLSFVILSSWKDTFRIIKSCEPISSSARDCKVIERCSESIAWKACKYTKMGNFGISEMFLNVIGENVSNFEAKRLPSNWWFEDAASLRIDHFIEVIASVKKKKIKPKIVGLCIAHWTRNWLSQVTEAHENPKQKNVAVQLHRVTTECLIRILPVEENSVTCNFLLHLFKMGRIMGIDSELLNVLDRRIASMLECCKAEELLVNNSATLFDVNIVSKVVDTYVSLASRNLLSKICAVGRLIDEYLVLVARDENLPAKVFQSLVEALPKRARYCDDNLYRAIDKYLKAHPNLTEEDRRSICRVLEFHKLSQEARRHAMKNERLPLSITTQFMLLEQVSMNRSLTATGAYYRRTKSQAILRVTQNLEKRGMNPHREVKVIKQDVEQLKAQLSELQLCKMELHRQMRKSFFC